MNWLRTYEHLNGVTTQLNNFVLVFLKTLLSLTTTVSSITENNWRKTRGTKSLVEMCLVGYFCTISPVNMIFGVQLRGNREKSWKEGKNREGKRFAHTDLAYRVEGKTKSTTAAGPLRVAAVIARIQTQSLRYTASQSGASSMQTVYYHHSFT